MIRDILHRLRDRFPSRLLLWPVLVQGEGAAEQVAAAIRGFNALDENFVRPRPDLLIVARGGGSIEDLWVFNEEIVARAAANSNIPIISAIGHETDTTLIDFVSDQRAPTPTAAAEMAVPGRSELISDILDFGRRLNLGNQRILAQKNSDLGGLARGLRGPRELLAIALQRLDENTERLERALLAFGGEKRAELTAIGGRLRLALVRDQVDRSETTLANFDRRLSRVIDDRIKTNKLQLTGQSKLLESLSFERVLDRGFAIVKKRRQTLVVNAADAEPGDVLTISFRDGDVGVTVDSGDTVTNEERQRKRNLSTGSRKNSIKDGQGSLF